MRSQGATSQGIGEADALAPAAALASSDRPPLYQSPSVPGGPSEPNIPDQPNSVCTARVNVNGATALGQLTNLKACPGTAGFSAAELTMLQAGCNHAQDVIRLRYTVVSGGTTLRPEIGECVRDSAVVFTRDV